MDSGFIERIDQFLEKYPEQRMRESLLQLFIDFLRYQDNQGSMPANTYTLLNDMEALFELLAILESYNTERG